MSTRWSRVWWPRSPICSSELPSGSVAVVAPDERCDEISDALNAAGYAHGRAATTGLDQSLTVVPVSVVKGLELDAVVVVEPAEIVGSDEHGMRARCTSR